MKAKKIFNKFVEGYKKLSEKKKEVLIQQPQIAQQIFIPFVQQPTQQKKKEIKIVKAEGIELPEMIDVVSPPEPKPIQKLRIKYPLIPKKPKKGEKVFAYAEIVWDKEEQKYVYNVIEPPIDKKISYAMSKVKEILETRLNVDFRKIKREEAIEYLKREASDIIKQFGFNLTNEEKDILMYYITRDFVGLGKIEPLMQDEEIEDISCDGVNIPIHVFHRNPMIGTVETNVVFKDRDELDAFVVRLAQLCGKSISVAEPLVDGTLPDGSRLQATLATDIARKGSNFTIRKFTKTPLTPIHLLKYRTLDEKVLAYLWLIVDYGRNVLIAGGTASGKTTLLNVLSLFIRPDRKIVSIEDTAELQLPHTHWVPMVARTPISSGKKGEIDLFDLLKASFRQRPDYIILGEVRGKEAYILFQQMATGHPSLATIHAENLYRLIDRLTTPPISLPPSLIEALDCVVFVSRTLHRNKFVRKVREVLEITGYDKEKEEPTFNLLFKWDASQDTFNIMSKSHVLEKIAEDFGLSKEEIMEEFKRRVMILKWMKDKNITDYRDVYKVFKMYYAYPSRLLAAIRGS